MANIFSFFFYFLLSSTAGAANVFPCSIFIMCSNLAQSFRCESNVLIWIPNYTRTHTHTHSHIWPCGVRCFVVHAIRNRSPFFEYDNLMVDLQFLEYSYRNCVTCGIRYGNARRQCWRFESHTKRNSHKTDPLGFGRVLVICRDRHTNNILGQMMTMKHYIRCILISCQFIRCQTFSWHSRNFYKTFFVKQL